MWRWTFVGYAEAEPLESGAEVDVLTPRSIVGAFAAGFRPLAEIRDRPHRVL
jgi:hypothetical protein